MWITVNLPWLKTSSPRKAGDDFLSSGLCVAGVQVELRRGLRLLIGHVNEWGSVGDDSSAFRQDDIVVRYRRLLSAEDLGS